MVKKKSPYCQRSGLIPREMITIPRILKFTFNAKSALRNAGFIEFQGMPFGPDYRYAMLSDPANPAIFAEFFAIAFPTSLANTSGRNFTAYFACHCVYRREV
jgi:hypothetical protein